MLFLLQFFTGFRRIIILIAIFSASWIIHTVSAQELTDYEIKTALIYNFTKYINWKYYSNPDTFKIGVYGNDQVMNKSLLTLQGQQIKGKYTEVYMFDKLIDIIHTDIIYVNYDNNYDVSRIFRFIEGNSTLLITDRYDFKREVMINFIHTEDGKVQFELNTRNLESANLTISPKLLLLGGTELDIRDLYKETEQSLITEKERSAQYEKELLERKKEIHILNQQFDSIHHEVESQRMIINFQHEKIQKQQSSLNEIQEETEELLSQINTQKHALDSVIRSLKSKNEETLLLDLQLSKKQAEMKNYNIVLSKLKNEKKELENAVKEYRIQIRSQRAIMLIAVAFVVLLLIFIIYINRNYKANQRKNKELERRNKQINRQKDQIFKQAEQLKHTNIELEKLSIVAEKTDNAVIIMDNLGKIEWVNDGFERMYGYKMEEFIKERGDNFIIASSSKNPNQILEKCVKRKTAVSYESPIKTKSEKIKWLQTTLSPIINDNKVEKLVAIDFDISELKKAESKIIKKNVEIQKHTEYLQRANFELELEKAKAEDALKKLKNAQSQLIASEKMASLGQLTAGIAHEINNPINFISSSIEGLSIAVDDMTEILDEYKEIDSENFQDKLNKIDHLKNKLDYDDLINGFGQLTNNIKIGIDRTKEIISSLRTFYRIDEDNFVPTDINSNIDSTILLLGKQYEGRIKITKKYHELPLIDCLPGKINQAFLNILVNAIQAIPEKGEIQILTGVEKRNNNTYIKIEFTDDGIGMPKIIKEKIFEPFFTTKEVGKGTGLGMSITYSIIQQHNGEIKVNSQEGKGTTITIYLPQKR